MNKNKFLKQLEENLMILEESERQDIINDYKEIIEEKVKSGEEEKSVIESFGKIEDLTKEILSSYKINSNYDKKNVDTKKIIEDGNNWIKRVSKQLANFVTETFNNLKNSKGLSVELVFELLIKALILLVICAILRLPFMLIEGLGVTIFSVFSPFDFILIIIWKILVVLCYLVGCVLLFFAVFKNYLKNSKETAEEKVEKSKSKKKDKNNIEENKSDDGVVADKKDNTIINIFKWVIRFFIVVCVLVPLIFVNVGLVCLLVLVLWFVFSGINILGLAILTLGLCVLGFEIYYILYSLTFKKFRISIWSFAIGIVLVVSGGLVFTNNIISFNYYETSGFGDMKTVVFEETINRKTEINVGRIIIDDTLDDNVVKISVTYYEEFNNVYKRNIGDEIQILVIPESNFNNLKTIYKKVVDDLKDGVIYNYDNLSYYNIVVYANSKTVKLLDN